MNKKIFHVGTEFKLTKKPNWLTSFKKKYNDPYPYHVTFKNDTFVTKKEIGKLKHDLKKITEKHAEFKIVFNKLFISKSKQGECIMIKAKESSKLTNLQKEISKKLSKYGENTNKEYEDFEKNFQPHITIARYLTKKKLEKARNDLGKDLLCETKIKKVVLTIVKEANFQEAINKKNKTFYNLD